MLANNALSLRLTVPFIYSGLSGELLNKLRSADIVDLAEIGVVFVAD